MNPTRVRPALYLVCILIAFFGVLYLASQSILGGSYAAIEKQSVEANVSRARASLQDDLDELNRKAGGWASWDEAYAFVQTGGPEFIRKNVSPDSFQRLAIDYNIFLDPSGAIVSANGYDLAEKRPLDVPPSLLRLLRQKRTLAKILQTDPSRPGLTGILLTQDAPLLIAARPILTSDGAGPVMGTLVFVRRFDAAALASLAARTHLTLTAERADRPPASDDLRLATDELSDASPVYAHADSDRSIFGYGLVDDIFGQPAMVLRVDLPRDIYAQGQATLSYWLIVILLAAAGFLGVSYLWSARLGSDLPAPPESRNRYQTIVEHAAEGIIQVDAGTTRVLEANSAFLETFGYSSHDVPKLYLRNIVSRSPSDPSPEALGFGAFVGERIYRRKDGVPLQVEANASLISQNGHRVMSVIIRDVTARNRAQAEVQQQALYFSSLYDAGLALNSELEPGKPVEHVLQIVSQFVPAERAAFYRYDPEGKLLRYETGLGSGLAEFPQTIEQFDLSTGTPRGIVSQDLGGPESIQIVDLEDLRWINPESEENSAIWTPVVRGSECLGLLLVSSSRSDAFTPSDRQVLALLAFQLAVAMKNAHSFHDLEDSYLQTVLALSRAVDAKDRYTGDHSDRLADLALALGRKLGLSDADLEDLRLAALLHDIGKIGVDDSILKKPGRLSSDEWAKMRQHPEIGARILAPVPRLARAAEIIRHHHERLDGNGYPDRLVGEAIPLGARILTIVDSFSAIVDEGIYKAGRSPAIALAELKHCAGTQFDSRLVHIFVEMQKGGEIDYDPLAELMIPSPVQTLVRFDSVAPA